jgi:hypothetical protein
VVEVGPTKPFEDIFDEIGGTAPGEFPSVAGDYGTAGDYPPESPSPSSSSARSAPPNQPPEQRDERDQAAARENPDVGGFRDSPNIDGEYRDPACSGEGSGSGEDGPPPRPRRRDSGRDTQAQTPGRHITGEAAMRAANRVNEMNREIGALPPLRELQSPHRRYPRP